MSFDVLECRQIVCEAAVYAGWDFVEATADLCGQGHISVVRLWHDNRPPLVLCFASHPVPWFQVDQHAGYYLVRSVDQAECLIMKLTKRVRLASA